MEGIGGSGSVLFGVRVVLARTQRAGSEDTTMCISRLLVSASVCLLFVLPHAGTAQAASRHHRGHRAAPVPSADAVELGILAPPAPALSTLEQSYGDAAIARARYQHQDGTSAPGAETSGLAPYPCDPRSARASGYVCHNVPGAIGYGQTYAFTPSFVSSPQTIGRAPTEQTSLLPPVTALFYAVDALRYDPHN